MEAMEDEFFNILSSSKTRLLVLELKAVLTVLSEDTHTHARALTQRFVCLA